MTHNHRRGAGRCPACKALTVKERGRPPAEPFVRTALTRTELQSIQQLLKTARANGFPQTKGVVAVAHRVARLSGLLDERTASENAAA